MNALPILLESLLFAAGEPLEKKRAAALLGISLEDVEKTAESLQTALKGRGITLVETKDALELRSAPEASVVIKRLRESELSRDLGQAGLEVLSIILYRTGVTRSDIDWIRGVNSSATVRTLAMRGLIKGKEDAADRRRIRYEITPEALAYLGISRVEDLPHYATFASLLTEHEEGREKEGEENPV